MYVYEEIVNSQKLSDIINQLHENVKYLPGHRLPENIVSFVQHLKLHVFSECIVLIFKIISLNLKRIKHFYF